jgi:hypothetical protein
MRRLLLLLLPASILLSACPTEPPARVYPIETADQRVGGPSALAIEGDWILENEHIRAGILSERCVGIPGVDEVCSSPGPGLFGGSVIDIDLNRHDAAHSSGRGKDQFAEMFSAVNLDVTQVQSVEVLADGSDGGPAILRVQGPPGDYISYIGLLGGILGLAEGWYYTDYILRPGDPYLTLRTHISFQSPGAGQDIEKPATDPCGWVQGDEGLPCDDVLVEIPRDTRVPTVDALNGGATQFGDFFFAGGNVDIFLPGIGFQEDHAVVNAMNSGVNPFVDPFDLPWVAATGDGVSYALGTGGQMAAPIFTSSLTAVYGAAFWPEVDLDGEPIQPPDGTVMSYQRFVGLGDGDIASAVDALYIAFADHDMPVGLGAIEGRVLEEGTLAPVSGVDVLVYLDDPDAPLDVHGLPPSTHMVSHFETDGGRDSIPDGSFSGRLPGGDYLLVTKDSTRGLGEPRRVTVPDGGTLETGLIAAQPGTLEIDVVDERGRGLPCKVSLRPLDEYTDISLPDLGDPYIGGGYSKVILIPAGHGRLELPTGRYDVLITRGLEYGIWDSVTEGWPDGVVLSPGQTSAIDAVLGVEVDSTGFISADLHVHASPSHDSGIPLETRAISMASEGVDFMAGTDHDYVTDYKPVIEALELGPWLQATTGLETTTMELGHYIAFPFEIDYTAEAGGALDWTGLTPRELIEALKGMGPWGPDATSVVVAHPRDGILGYFDQYGLDHFSGDFLSPNLEVPLMNGLSNPLLVEENFTLDFDGFELFNGKRFDLIRTPTHDEMERNRAYLDGEPGSSPVGIYEIISRTMEEQEALADLSQDFFLTTELEGTVDDWFNLLNLGFRHTGVGNSDTHGISSTEAGCPRNFVISEVDSPELIDERDVATAINEHRVVPSYGPIIRFTADGMPIGSDVVSDTGTVTLDIEVQAPRWMLVDRVELYENGRLIAEFTGNALDPDAVVKFSSQIEVTPTVSALDATPQDAWYVVVALGDDDLAPVFTPVDIPHLQLNDIVVGALSEIDLGSLGAAVSSEGPPIPTTWPVFPYAITNPIWVDVDGTGFFDALGHLPYWWRPAPEPEE